MMRNFLLTALAASGVVAQTQFTATSASDVAAAAATAKSQSPRSFVPGRAFDRIAIIWLENTDYDKAIGDPNLAALAKQGITLSNYFGVTHPSEPNYAASIGGDNFGMENDNFNFIPKNVSTVIDLLESRGISWGHYQEDLPYTGFEGYAWINQQTGKNDYVRKHNPAVLYNAVTSRPDRIEKIKNTTLFFDDLEADRLPQWMFITPNMTSDGHDTSVTTAGAWTSNFVTPLLKNPKFMKNTLVLITFDETETYTEQNRVLAILLGDAVPKHLVGTTDSNYYDHYSEIATVEANWWLNHLGRNDAAANVFSFVAAKTGDKVRAWDAATGANPTVFLNQSFPGPFNSKNASVPFPAPNLWLDVNGRTIFPEVIEQWWNASSKSYYTNSVEIPDGLRPPPGY